MLLQSLSNVCGAGPIYWLVLFIVDYVSVSAYMSADTDTTNL